MVVRRISETVYERWVFVAGDELHLTFGGGTGVGPLIKKRFLNIFIEWKCVYIEYVMDKLHLSSSGNTGIGKQKNTFSPVTSSQVSSIGQSSCSLETASKFSMTHWSSVFFDLWWLEEDGERYGQGASKQLFFTCPVGLMCELYKVTHLLQTSCFWCLSLVGYLPSTYFMKHFLFALCAGSKPFVRAAGMPADSQRKYLWTLVLGGQFPKPTHDCCWGQD